MAASTRITAQNIKFLIDGDAYECDVDSLELTLSDSPGDVRTFCEVQTNQRWTLKLSGIMSGDSTSLYQVLFANYGSEVAFSVAPQGNSTATSSAPIWTGTVIFDQLPPLSLTSGETAKFTVDLNVKNAVHTPDASPAVFFGLTKTVS
jgi:hypothetical protein